MSAKKLNDLSAGKDFFGPPREVGKDIEKDVKKEDTLIAIEKAKEVVEKDVTKTQKATPKNTPTKKSSNKKAPIKKTEIFIQRAYYITDEQAYKIKELALRERTDASALVRKIFDEYFNKLEIK